MNKHCLTKDQWKKRNESRRVVRTSVDCPKCGAKQGSRCFRKSGARRTSPHIDRVIASKNLRTTNQA